MSQIKFAQPPKKEKNILGKTKTEPSISDPDLIKEVETALDKSCNPETIRRTQS